ncbi:MAG: hypothetical protein HGA36_04510 [Candidatus Moranbacteria bacterium]|nr:hypothetical protein [Candidatus Moranbacteria bacterium]
MDIINLFHFFIRFKNGKFSLKNQNSDKWVNRSKVAISFMNGLFLPNEKIKVGDFGCGDMKIKKILSELNYHNVLYSGYDCMPQNKDIQLANFNEKIPDEKFDVIFSMGLLEYLDDLEFFLNFIKNNAENIIVSYVIADSENYSDEEIKIKGWKNHLKSHELEAIFTKIGLIIQKSIIVDNGLTKIYLLKI